MYITRHVHGSIRVNIWHTNCRLTVEIGNTTHEVITGHSMCTNALSPNYGVPTNYAVNMVHGRQLCMLAYGGLFILFFSINKFDCNL